jgi:rRNA-processing protein FCF1
MQSNIRVEANFNGATKELILSNSNFVALQERISQLFSLNSMPTVTYKDDENDTISISSDQELAFACVEKNTLRVDIFANAAQEQEEIAVEPKERKQKEKHERRGRKHERQPQDNETYHLERIERIEQKIQKLKMKLETAGQKQEKITNKIAKLEEKKNKPLKEKKPRLEAKDKQEKQKIKDEKKIAKEEKHKQKEIKKAEKQVEKERKRQEKEFISGEDADLEQGWPSSIEKVYLDGNNMLFVPSYLRNKCLKRSRKSAEKSLSQMAIQVGNQLNLELTHVMYDATTNRENGDTFVVSSARPTYETSDDALVEIAKQAMNVDLDSCLFVTSDRGLRLRLKQVGAKVIKPKQWFKFAFNKINANEENPFENIDQMLETKFSK